MELVEVVEASASEARSTYVADHPTGKLHHVPIDATDIWSKIDHLLYMPILGLRRARDLYYYQGDGLEVLYGFTYKYMTVEHFVGQLTRIQVGAPLAENLARAYVRAWYPGDEPLTIFVDWHVKPHWTKEASHSGHVTMWGRTMPGTKQLILNGPHGRLLGAWNYPIDTHMGHILVELEAGLEHSLSRPIACTIVDGEAGGLPIGERYVEAKRNYISVLPRGYTHSLTEFVLQGEWESVKDDPEREAVFAQWADAKRAVEDPRQLVLMRPVGRTDPTRVYTGWFRSEHTAGDIPWLHRGRWPNNELRIRDLIHGANLNCNYGYAYTEVPNRTRQREWEAAQARVEVTERQLSNDQVAVHNLRQRLTELQATQATQQRGLQHQIIQSRLELQLRHCNGQPTLRVQQRIERLRQTALHHSQRFQRQQRSLLQQLYQHQTQASILCFRLKQRIAERDAIDTETLCRERDLEKDQIMLNWQLLLANLHDWVTQNYFAPEWRTLSLEKASQMIYCKAGHVIWHADCIEVLLLPYRYRDQQRAMEATCARFNAAKLRWRDGRLLRISVMPYD
jgi:hypothetical protein